MAPSSSTSRRLLLGAGVVICLVSGVAIWMLSEIHQMHVHEVERSAADLNRQLVDIESGKKDNIHLYDTTDTDELLESISHNSNVRRLYLELTDVSDAGFESLAQMPELHTLTVYGGRPSLTDGGLAALASNEAIEEFASH